MSFLVLVDNQSTGAGNGAPTLITQGVPFGRGAGGRVVGQGLPDDFDEGILSAEATVTAAAAGSIAFLQLYGWLDKAIAANKWFPLGPAALDADRGKLNNAVAIGEIAAGDDFIRYAERVRGLRECSRLYLRYGALSNITRLDAILHFAGVIRGR